MNSWPQGPWAIPPRHGQSQLISPLGRTIPYPSSCARVETTSGFPASSWVTKTDVSLPAMGEEGGGVKYCKDFIILVILSLIPRPLPDFILQMWRNSTVLFFCRVFSTSVRYNLGALSMNSKDVTVQYSFELEYTGQKKQVIKSECWD